MTRFKKMQIVPVVVFLMMIGMTVGTTSIIYAGDPPYIFSSGGTISSSQVNANFQALSERIAALEAKLAQVSPASIAGTYDYYTLGIGMKIENFPTQNNYNIARNNYRGTIVLDASGTVTINGTGGYNSMWINNQTGLLCGQGSVCSEPNADTRSFSLISGDLSNIDPTDVGTGNYTLNGSTITMAGGSFVGTFSADGKILVGMSESNSVDLMIAIKRP